MVSITSQSEHPPPTRRSPMATPPTSSPIEHPPVFKGYLATIRHESLHRMNSQAKSVTRSWAQTQISYFLKSLLCSLLFKSDSISLFRVSFSLRSWKSREREREDVDHGKKSAVTRTPAAPSLRQHQGSEARQGTAEGLLGRWRQRQALGQ